MFLIELGRLFQALDAFMLDRRGSSTVWMNNQRQDVGGPQAATGTLFGGLVEALHKGTS